MKTYLESEEIKLLELSATNSRDRLLIRLLSRLGCRISEALVLTVEDIDFQERMITIQHLKTRLKLACPYCNAKLATSHVFCPGCGLQVEKAVAQSKEHRRLIVAETTTGALGSLLMPLDYAKVFGSKSVPFR